MLETTENTPLGYRANISQAKLEEIMEIRTLVLHKSRAQPGYGTPGHLWDARAERKITDEAVAEGKAKRAGKKGEADEK